MPNIDFVQRLYNPSTGDGWAIGKEEFEVIVEWLQTLTLAPDTDYAENVRDVSRDILAAMRARFEATKDVDDLQKHMKVRASKFRAS